MTTNVDFITQSEDVRLSSLALKINSGLNRLRKAFIESVREVGPALEEAKRIHKSKRGACWRQFCETECNMSLATADRYVAAARIIRLLEESGTRYPALPASDAHCAPLVRLPDDAIAPAWELIVETCGVDITSDRIKETLASDDRFRGSGKGKGVKSKRRPLTRKRSDQIAEAKKALAALAPADRQLLITSLKEGANS